MKDNKFPYRNFAVGDDKVKLNVHPRTGHEGPDGEKKYSSNLSLT
jgi:hypothetical protein